MIVSEKASTLIRSKSDPVLPENVSEVDRHDAHRCSSPDSENHRLESIRDDPRIRYLIPFAPFVVGPATAHEKHASIKSKGIQVESRNQKETAFGFTMESWDRKSFTVVQSNGSCLQSVLADMLQDLIDHVIGADTFGLPFEIQNQTVA